MDDYRSPRFLWLRITLFAGCMALTYWFMHYLSIAGRGSDGKPLFPIVGGLGYPVFWQGLGTAAVFEGVMFLLGIPVKPR